MNYELEHSGIKGQKWGHRNGPPYPLGASDHSASEKRAGTKGWTVKAKKEAKKKVSEMSDDELRKAVDRKRLENRYKTLKRGDGTLYDTVKRVTDSASEIAENKFGKKSPEKKVLGKARKLEDQVNSTYSKVKDKKTETKTDISKMSDEELKKQINRLQLEKDYKDLNPDSIQRGMKAAANLIETGVAVYVVAKNAPAIISKGKEFIGNALENGAIFLWRAQNRLI